jgi:hypothetical protein
MGFGGASGPSDARMTPKVSQRVSLFLALTLPLSVHLLLGLFASCRSALLGGGIFGLRHFTKPFQNMLLESLIHLVIPRLFSK